MTEPRHVPGMPLPGEQIAGKYRILRTIGAGGMGCVFEAEHTLLRSRVAIKLLLPQAAALPGATERFLREAQTAATLRSEHVTRVLDVGTSEKGSPFLVMEYLAGQDLRRVIRERTPLPIEEAAAYLLQTCEALLEAHALGILHRDIKPANIFLTARPDGAPLVKVLDFGLAKVLAVAHPDLPEESITETGQVIGSPHYMPPEQFRSLRNADVRSDIWALGVVAYELFTGKRPFLGEGMAGVMMSVITDEPAPVASLRPDLPQPLADLVMRCLSKPPERRPQWIAELVTALRPFASLPEPQPVSSQAALDSRWGRERPQTPDSFGALQAAEAARASQRLTARDSAPAADTARGVPKAGAPAVRDEAEPPAAPPYPPTQVSGRSTLRMGKAGPLSAADGAAEGPAQEAPSAAMAMSSPEGALPPRSSTMKSGPSAPDDITDLNQSATTSAARRTAARSRWIALGAALVVTIAAGVGVRFVTASAPDKPAEEQASIREASGAPPPATAPEPSAAARATASIAAPSAVPSAAPAPPRAVAAPGSAKASAAAAAVTAAPSSSLVNPWPAAKPAASPAKSSKPAGNPNDPFNKYN